MIRGVSTGGGPGRAEAGAAARASGGGWRIHQSPDDSGDGAAQGRSGWLVGRLPGPSGPATRTARRRPRLWSAGLYLSPRAGHLSVSGGEGVEPRGEAGRRGCHRTLLSGAGGRLCGLRISGEMLSAQCWKRADGDAAGRSSGGGGLPGQDGDGRGEANLPTTRSGGRVSECLDQGEDRTATVLFARVRESKDGGDVGLPHLQRATMGSSPLGPASCRSDGVRV